MNLFCVGLSHHRARVEELEQFAGRPETLDSLRQAGCAEALLLSTCNRVEVYAAAEALVPIPQVALPWSRFPANGGDNAGFLLL
jgi:glutamyl-tRNA reductase